MRKVGVVATLLFIGGAIGYGICGSILFYWPTTLVSLSPDDQLRVTLIEHNLGIDRNFHLRLEQVKTGQSRTIFRSPDEGRPIGSERIIWSTDGSRLLLLGRHFYVIDSGKLESGEQAYLMMDLPSGKIWCNADQRTEYPRFTNDDLKLVSWAGWNPE